MCGTVGGARHVTVYVFTSIGSVLGALRYCYTAPKEEHSIAHRTQTPAREPHSHSVFTERRGQARMVSSVSLQPCVWLPGEEDSSLCLRCPLSAVGIHIWWTWDERLPECPTTYHFSRSRGATQRARRPLRISSLSLIPFLAAWSVRK